MSPYRDILVVPNMSLCSDMMSLKYECIRTFVFVRAASWVAGARPIAWRVCIDTQTGVAFAQRPRCQQSTRQRAWRFVNANVVFLQLPTWQQACHYDRIHKSLSCNDLRCFRRRRLPKRQESYRTCANYLCCQQTILSRKYLLLQDLRPFLHTFVLLTHLARGLHLLGQCRRIGRHAKRLFHKSVIRTRVYVMFFINHFSGV